MSGTSAECQKDLFERFESNHLLPALAQFAKVTEDTVRTWQSGTIPKGSEQLRLRVFLGLLGYQVEEFKALPAVTQSFATLIAFDLITVEGATEEIGYANTNGIYDLILRGSGLYPDKQHRLIRYVESHKDTLDEIVAEYREVMVSNLLPGNRAFDVAAEDTVPALHEQRRVEPASEEMPPVSPVRSRPMDPEDGEATVIGRTLVYQLEATQLLLAALDETVSASVVRRHIRFVFGQDRLKSLIVEIEDILNS